MRWGWVRRRIAVESLSLFLFLRAPWVDVGGVYDQQQQRAEGVLQALAVQTSISRRYIVEDFRNLPDQGGSLYQS